MAECFWKCGDDRESHKHYSVLIRENGKILGRLTPNGHANRNRIHAAILSEERANKISAEINERGDFTAKVIPF